MAFLRREHSVLSIFVILVWMALWLTVGPKTAAAYLTGAASSVIAGFIGMTAATRANVRTAAAALEVGPGQGAPHRLSRRRGHGPVGGGARPDRAGRVVLPRGCRRDQRGRVRLVRRSHRRLRHGRQLDRPVRSRGWRDLHQGRGRGRGPGRQVGSRHPRGRPAQPGHHRRQRGRQRRRRGRHGRGHLRELRRRRGRHDRDRGQQSALHREPGPGGGAAVPHHRGRPARVPGRDRAGAPARALPACNRAAQRDPHRGRALPGRHVLRHARARLPDLRRPGRPVLPGYRALLGAARRLGGGRRDRGRHRVVHRRPAGAATSPRPAPPGPPPTSSAASRSAWNRPSRPSS